MIDEVRIKNLQEQIPQVEVLNVPDEQEPPSLFTVNGVEVVSKKAVTIIGAQKKSGKTQFAGLQMAACISSDKQVLNGAIRNTDDVKDILYVDTEQPWRDCRRTLRRVMKTAGYCYDEAWNEHGIRCISVKDIDETDRMDMIELAIQQYKPQLVIVDGIADLISSINDEQHSKEILAWMDAMACQYDCAMEGMLHLNFGSSKLGGWAGTVANKKFTDYFLLKKDKEHGLFTVEHEGRGETAPKLFFKIFCPLGDKIGWWQPLDTSLIAELTKEDAEELELRNLMNAAPLPCNNASLVSWLMNVKRWTSKSPANKALKKCKELGILNSRREGNHSIWFKINGPDPQEQELELSDD